MRILAIETSCDETAISVVGGKGGLKRPSFKVLAHLVSSQTAIHAPFGGVVPNLAKREHQRNLVPLLVRALEQSRFNFKGSTAASKGPSLKTRDSKDGPWVSKVKKILAREPELLDQFLKIIPNLKIPKVDAIAVTQGPGLEPALWVGINFAKALGAVWNLPVIPINHMEGHVVSALVKAKVKGQKAKLEFPALALLVSGGHTEIVLMKNWGKYRLIGQTRDDAVGEAFDKVARILGLPYPGGPALSKLAATATHLAPQLEIALPRPMLNSPDFDFSFSGLKTAVLYLTQKLSSQGSTLKTQNSKVEPLPESLKAAIAHEFQEAVIEVLATKTFRAVEKFKPRTLLIGGGVIANTALRNAFALKAKSSKLPLLIPDQSLTTDNATMIGAAAYLQLVQKKKATKKNFSANGNLVLK